MRHYRIAGLTVAMDTFGRTLEQAKPYEIEINAEPDIVINSYAHELLQHHPEANLNLCEYMGSGSSFYTQLLKFDGMMLHASCVVVDGRAYLFTAPSGTGKSTHTTLWLNHFGDRAYILNDDKPALRLEDGLWYAYGTPWSGKYDMSRNVCVPVAGIALVNRGEENEIHIADSAEAIAFLMTQVVRPGSAENRIRVLEVLDKLMTKVPIWKLKCNMEPQAALVSYEVMSGGKKEN